MKQAKGIDKHLDTAWSLLVKLIAGNECEVDMCGKTTTLNSHHIYTRANKAVRWSTKNGICLCASHHVLSSDFSAHGTPIPFNRWLEKKRGSDFMDLLEAKARSISKLHTFEKELLLKELQKEIKLLQ